MHCLGIVLDHGDLLPMYLWQEDLPGVSLEAWPVR